MRVIFGRGWEGGGQQWQSYVKADKLLLLPTTLGCFVCTLACCGGDWAALVTFRGCIVLAAVLVLLFSAGETVFLVACFESLSAVDLPSHDYLIFTTVLTVKGNGLSKRCCPSLQQCRVGCR